MNPQMFNSFLDGTKSAIEMAAIANACGLDVPERRAALPALRRGRPGARPAAARAGGQLEGEGMVEVVSSLERDGRPVCRDLRWGVYVVLEGAERLCRRLLRAVRAARPTPAAATPRCTSRST